MRTVEEPTTITSASDRNPTSIDRSASPERARELPKTTVDPSRLMTMHNPIVGRLAFWLTEPQSMRDRAMPYASAIEMESTGAGKMRLTENQAYG